MCGSNSPLCSSTKASDRTERNGTHETKNKENTFERVSFDTPIQLLPVEPAKTNRISEESKLMCGWCNLQFQAELEKPNPSPAEQRPQAGSPTPELLITLV